MKKFVLKSLLIILLVFGPVISLNLIVDPAHLFNKQLVENAADALSAGQVIESPGDFDEGLLLDKVLDGLKNQPDTIIVGSSHIMYTPWAFDNYYVAGLSGAYVGDYFGVIGLLDSKDMLPKKLVFGIDPWAFDSSYDNGRHSYLSPMASYEYNYINGNKAQASKLNFGGLEKVKEVYSFSYFQSSVKNLQSRGLNYYFGKSANDIKTVSDPLNSKEALIFPNGSRKMPASAYESFESINNAAISAVESKKVYQLKADFNPAQSENFSDFLKLLNSLMDRGLEVEIYLASWHPVLYDYFENSSDYHGVVLLEQALRDFAKESKIVLHGSYNPEACNVTAEDFSDWLHLKPEKMLENFNVILDK